MEARSTGQTGVRESQTQNVESRQGRRLSDALSNPCRGAFHRVKSLPHNHTAIRACEDFACGRDYLVALVGPSGWGKSLLLHSVADWMSQEYHQEIRVHNTLDWLKNPPRPETLVPFILDDIQEAVRQPKARHKLRTVLERRIRLKRPTLVSMTAWNGPASLSTSVPYVHEWTLGTVDAPPTHDRRSIIHQMAEIEGLRLSSSLVGLMARHIDGNGCSINGALRCLSLMKRDWSGPADACRACGILMPFLVLHEGWDPRDVILDCVQRTVSAFPGYHFQTSAVAGHLMLAMANLGEDSVARHLQITPTEVYNFNAFVLNHPSGSEFARFVETCRREVVRAFSDF